MKKSVASAGPNSGETRCLGWCNKTFWSADKTKIRFCTKCRSRRNNLSESMSRVEMQQMNRGEQLNINEENS